EEARYDLIANGLKVGHFFLWWEEDGSTYKATFMLKTSGLVRFFKPQDRYAQTIGTIRRENGKVILLPKLFKATSKGRHKSRSIEIAYDEQGNVTASTVTPPDNPATRPAVSQQGKNAGYDALTAIQMLFAMASEMKSKSEFTVFDGRRLTRIHLAPPQVNPFVCQECPAYKISREPAEGFDADDLKDYQKGDPPVRVSIDPIKSRFPAAARVDVSWGVLTAKRQ
ncbi:MAG: DUF3108 domain-containing protein, partial [Rickettsiales bacterium]